MKKESEVDIADWMFAVKDLIKSIEESSKHYANNVNKEELCYPFMCGVMEEILTCLPVSKENLEYVKNASKIQWDGLEAKRKRKRKRKANMK